MATLDMTAEEFKTVEAMRQRLQILTNSLDSLRRDISQSYPLPNPASLQTSAKILQQNLASLQRILSDNNDFFQSMVVHPSTNYPGRMQENVLGSLLRKKLEPDIEVAVEAARQAALSAGVDVSKMKRKHEEDKDEDEEDSYHEEEDEDAGDPLTNLWADARLAINEKLREFVSTEAKSFFTAAEREMGIENVRTGLKRDLVAMERQGGMEEDDEDEEEDDDDDGDMRDPGILAVQNPTGPGQTKPGQNELLPEEILSFMTRGETVLPRGIETQSAKIAAGKSKGLGGR